jgi:hypothetical protein
VRSMQLRECCGSLLLFHFLSCTPSALRCSTSDEQVRDQGQRYRGSERERSSSTTKAPSLPKHDRSAQLACNKTDQGNAAAVKLHAMAMRHQQSTDLPSPRGRVLGVESWGCSAPPSVCPLSDGPNGMARARSLPPVISTASPRWTGASLGAINGGAGLGCGQGHE